MLILLLKKHFLLLSRLKMVVRLSIFVEILILFQNDLINRRFLRTALIGNINLL